MLSAFHHFSYSSLCSVQIFCESIPMLYFDVVYLPYFSFFCILLVYFAIFLFCTSKKLGFMISRFLLAFPRLLFIYLSGLSTITPISSLALFGHDFLSTVSGLDSMCSALTVAPRECECSSRTIVLILRSGFYSSIFRNT